VFELSAVELSEFHCSTLKSDKSWSSLKERRSSKDIKIFSSELDVDYRLLLKITSTIIQEKAT